MSHYCGTCIFIIVFGILFTVSTTEKCDSKIALDLIFMLDASGNVYDANYINWQYELDFAKTIINTSLPDDTQIGTIIFSGCGTSYSFQECIDEGRLNKVWGLKDYGVPNDQQAVYDRFAAIGPDDFPGGYIWTDEALTIALNEFELNSSKDRSKMIILLTAGKPSPYDSGHEPCIASTGYVSSTLQSLKDLGTLIVTIGIDVTQSTIDDMFTCIMDDFDKYFFYANDFPALPGLTTAIGDIVCNDDISLIINEVGLNIDYDGNGKHLYFVELYNRLQSVSLTGYEFGGLINYSFTENIVVSQGEYWVISTYDMNSMDQVECRNCSQDLLISDSNIDIRMNNSYWKLDLYNDAGELLDSVERNQMFFPLVSDGYTHQLQHEILDNALGGNWKESCYHYGTPQALNQEPCSCDSTKCMRRGDNAAYCGNIVNYMGQSVVDCVCSNQFILSGGVCNQVFAPSCCYAFEEDCLFDVILLAWCNAGTSSVESYRIYKNNQPYITVSSTIKEYLMIGNNSCAGNFSISSIYQSSPLIESPKIYCPLTAPTPSPTSPPTRTPIVVPTYSPTTDSPTTETPSYNPTTSVPTLSPTYPDPTTSSPSNAPTVSTTSDPTKQPITANPTTSTITQSPTQGPTLNHTNAPTIHPTSSTTKRADTAQPTTTPTEHVNTGHSNYFKLSFKMLFLSFAYCVRF